MLDFRKVLLALSVASLGLVGTASAQVAQITLIGCNGSPNACTEGYVASEGMTEIVPQINLTLANSASITGSLILTVTSNAPFNNQQIAGTLSGQLDVTATDNVGDAASGATGSVTQTGVSTIQITFKKISAGANQINIVGLRSNASALPVGSQITINLSSPSIAIATQPGVLPLPVAYTAASISSVVISGQATISSCTTSTASNPAVLTATVTNGFPDSLKSVADYTVVGNNAAGQGTVLAVTFTNLNPGVSYYVPLQIGAGTVGNFTLVAYTSPSISAATIAPVATAPYTFNAAIPGETAFGANQVQLTTTTSASGTSASATIYYAVTVSIVGTEQAAIPVTAVLPTGGLTTFDTGAPGVSVVPVGTAAAIDPATAYPEYLASATPVTGSGQIPGFPEGLVKPCTTTLLFPYVISIAGFDTGLAITNASGTFGVAGSCNVTYWGTGAPTPNTVNTGIIAPPNATNTPPASGAYVVYPFDVGTAAPGFNGYVQAVCNFQGAHGYAFVSDGLATSTGIGANYLAIVTSDQVGAAAVVTATAE